jgi:hypothetical protein
LIASDADTRNDSSALPGLPVISLDALREEMDVDPGDDQGEVVARAKSSARE